MGRKARALHAQILSGYLTYFFNQPIIAKTRSLRSRGVQLNAPTTFGHHIQDWAGRESNPYGRNAQRLLRPSRLPVSPPAPHYGLYYPNYALIIKF